MKPVTITIENYTEKSILLAAIIKYILSLNEMGKKYQYPEVMLPTYFEFQVAIKKMQDISEDIFYKISHAKAPE